MNKSSLPTGLKEAVGALLDDHHKVTKLFAAFDKAKTDDEKEEIAQTICNELTVHASIEEEVFYPAVREIDPEQFGDLLDEALVEHTTAKELIAQISAMGPQDELFDAKVKVLGEYVRHHVQEEEGEVFPKLIEQKCDLRPLVQRMEEMRPARPEAA